MICHDIRNSFQFNGLMIDCARMMERHSYYFELVDFMARWGMDTLLFHFSDDQGLGIGLSGFEEIAMPEAFSVEEVKRLIGHASAKGIDVIPELETFGHIRYLTDHPAYAHLFAGSQFNPWAFNAINPTHPQTLEVMARLLKSTCDLFDSPYVHIGCDEVDMNAFCESRGLDKSKTWVDYVNKIIGITQENGRTAMMWGDHPTKDAVIAGMLRKDVILVDWRYEPEIDETVGGRLASMGFQAVVAAPSAGCYEMRFQTSETGFENIRKMVGTAFRHGYAGVINTVWCPFRYYQDAILMGFAFGAEAARSPNGVDMAQFHKKFAETELDAEPTPQLLEFLAKAPFVEFEWQMAAFLLDQNQMRHVRENQEEIIAMAKRSSDVGASLFPLLPKLKGNGKLQSMILAVEASWAAAEALVIQQEAPGDQARIDRQKEVLRRVRDETPAYWTKGRFPKECDSPLQGSDYASARLVNILSSLS